MDTSTENPRFAGKVAFVTAGVKGFAGQAAYCAAKHGVIGLTKAAALDYAASNIRMKRSPRPCCGCARTPRRSLSATLSSSTAARRCK